MSGHCLSVTTISLLRSFTLPASLGGAASPCQIWVCVSGVLPVVPRTVQVPLYLGKQRLKTATLVMGSEKLKG